MKIIFNSSFLKENELLFWIYLTVIIIIMILTILFVYKELGKKK